MKKILFVLMLFFTISILADNSTKANTESAQSQIVIQTDAHASIIVIQNIHLQKMLQPCFVFKRNNFKNVNEYKTVATTINVFSNTSKNEAKVSHSFYNKDINTRKRMRMNKPNKILTL